MLALAGCLLVAAAAAVAAPAPAAVRSCPARAPAEPSGPAARGGAPLVRAGATTVLLCRYRGLNPPTTALRLAARLVLRSPATIETLTRELDALPRASRLVMCPMDDGSEIVATFTHGASTLAVVDVGLSGCRLAHSGGATRSAIGPPGRRLLSLLASLVG